MTMPPGADPAHSAHDTAAAAASPGHWPPGVPQHAAVPATHLFHNVQQAAQRHPDKPFIVCGEQTLTFQQLREQAEAVAAWLQQVAGIQPGDRVLLALRNGPEWALACWGILRADAVVVPLQPASSEQEQLDIARDSGARVAFVPPQRLLRGAALERSVVVPDPAEPGEADTAGRLHEQPDAARLVPWQRVLASGLQPLPLRCTPHDPAVMPYTSGSTGRPKGCLHTHGSVMSAVVAGATWFSCGPEAVFLATLPFFHVTGFVGSLHIPLLVGGTAIVMPRWNRAMAARLIERHRVTHWHCITSMVVDLLACPALAGADLSSLRSIRGGGAAMPQAVARQLKARTGLDYVEGYGLSETMAATHLNPPHRPKPQCLGLPLFGVDARIVAPGSLRELPRGAGGEIVIHAPQLMRGYWRQPEADAEAFVWLDGKRFLRSGDFGFVDDEGYFFMTDRLKRMINRAGLKVWPAEVEAALYRHPAIQEACVIAMPDPRRGEAVKALVVLRAGSTGVTARELMHWARRQLSAYKAPCSVELVAALPRSASGKVMWRELQEREFMRGGPTHGHALRGGAADDGKA
jgi:fatty-acyl-CoA synthase